VGRVHDAAAFWRGVHVACLPSRGGEGLPRTLLEAAACGRPIVTSDAPGCADFVGGDAIGLVTPRDDVAALAAALQRLAFDAELRRRMGEAARAKVLAGYTEAHAAAVAARAWHAVLQP
jgi:glycosyltransferase involved in cell wall biosynthesis